MAAKAKSISLQRLSHREVGPAPPPPLSVSNPLSEGGERKRGGESNEDRCLKAATTQPICKYARRVVIDQEKEEKDKCEVKAPSLKL